MADQSAGNAEEQLTIRLELESEYDAELDQAIVGEIGRDTLAALRQEDYTVLPVDMHTRGGEFVVDLLKAAWEHKETIERAMTDLSSLATILGYGVVPVMLSVVQAHKKRALPGSGTIKLTVEICGAPVSVEVEDLEQAEAALLLARKFYSSYPQVASKISPKCKAKVKGKLPKQQRRGRR